MPNGELDLTFKYYPSLLQRYIFKELLSVFFLSLTALLSLVLIGRGLQLREMFVGLELGLGDIAWLFLCLTPLFMLMVMPIACMLSVFLTFLKMSTDRELLALRAGGISLKELLPAPLVFCSLGALITVLISIYSISWGMMEFRSTIMEIATTRAKLVLRPGAFNQDIPGLTIFARKVNLHTNELTQVLVEDRSKEKSSLVILAPHGSLATDETRGEILFNLLNGRLYRTSSDQVSVLGFDTYTVRIGLADLFKDMSLGEVRPKEMSWDQLFELIKTGNIDEINLLRKAKVEVQKRLTFPVACVILGFFALPLACIFEGVNRQIGIVLALVMFFVYYSLSYMGMNLAESGKLPAIPAVWAPNVIFLGLGIYLFNRALHERVPNVRYAFNKLKRRVVGYINARRKTA